MEYSQVHVFHILGLHVHLIVTPNVSDITYVITIDLANGGLFFSSTPYVDVFPTHRIACDSITNAYLKSNSSKTRIKQHTGKALIGFAVENDILVIGLVQETRKLAILPNGSSIKQIESADFISIPFKSCCNNKPPSFKDFPLNDMHFYCDCFDITRPYPSTHSVVDYDDSFCWNQRWRIPFIHLGLDFLPVVLLQGYAETSTVYDANKYITFIARRSVLNPHSRYASRGLNNDRAPGNEVECEIIFYDDQQNFKSNCWRRGSIPIKWSTVVGPVGSGQHIVSPHQDEGTKTYFQRISNRFDGAPITVISLLKDSELILTNAYQEAIKNLDFVDFHSYDISSLPEKTTIETFQTFLKPLFDGSQFTIGNKNGIISRQSRLFRFNCVDSTDRTNVATFIYARLLFDFINGGVYQNQTIYNFLGNAFLKSGDIISMLYTSTEAAFSRVIRNTIIGISQSKFDISVSLIRRVKHFYGNDADSDKVINSWLALKYKYIPLYSLEYLRMSLIRNSAMNMKQMESIDPSIIYGEFTQITAKAIDGYAEVIIQLPIPMIICTLRLLFLPSIPNQPTLADSFTVSCGMDENHRYVYFRDVMIPDVKEPTKVRYPLFLAHKWGIQVPVQPAANEPARFVWITFKNNSKAKPISTASLNLLKYNVDRVEGAYADEDKNMLVCENSQKVPKKSRDKIMHNSMVPQKNYHDEIETKPRQNRRFHINPCNGMQQEQGVTFGNIGFDVFIPNTLVKLPAFDNQDPNVIEEYQKRLAAFIYNRSDQDEQQFKPLSIKCNRPIDQILDIELFRIKSNLSYDIRNDFMIKNGINPVITSLRSYLTCYGDQSLCAFCKSPFIANSNSINSADEFFIETDEDKSETEITNPVSYFFFHDQYKHLLNPLQSSNSNQIPTSLCKSCAQKLLKFSNDFREIESKIAKEECPMFKMRHWKLNEIKNQVNLAKSPYSTFLEYPISTNDSISDINMLLQSNDDSDNDEMEDFQIQPNLGDNNDDEIMVIDVNSENPHNTDPMNVKISSLHEIDGEIIEWENQSPEKEEKVIAKSVIIEEKVVTPPKTKKQRKKSDVKYVIDSSEQKTFVFNLCLTSLSIPSQLYIEFDGELPESVQVVPYMPKANPGISRSISTSPRQTSTMNCMPIPPSKQEAFTPSISISNIESQENFDKNVVRPYMLKDLDSITVHFASAETNSVTFIIQANPGQNAIILRRVKVLGHFYGKPRAQPKWFSFPVSKFRAEHFTGTWDQETQTQTYTFKSFGILRRVNFKIPTGCANGHYSHSHQSMNAANVGINKNTSTSSIFGIMSPGNKDSMNPWYKKQLPQSIIIALYNENNELVKYDHILVPNVLLQSEDRRKFLEMNFKITNSPPFVTIRIFYLDLIENLKPYEVEFLIDPQSPRLY